MPITVRSDFWNNSYAFQRASGAQRKLISRLLTEPSARKDRQLLKTLLGVVSGSTALSQLKRVAHDPSELGGKRTIQTVDIVNRVTTAADITDLSTNYLTYASRPTYPVDKATRP